MNSIIEARGIGYTHDGQTFLDHLELEIEPGECFGLVGPKSAGKTCAMEVLSARKQITDGELYVLGINARMNPITIRSQVGVLPQHHGFEMDLSSFEVLVDHSILYGLPRSRAKSQARELLRRVQLDETEDWPIIELNECQLARLCLARAMVNQPRIIFIDHEFAHFPNQEKEKFWKIVEHSRREGTTYILLGRDLENVERMCGRVAILERGRIICQGHPAQLIATHIGRSVVEYLVKPNDLEYHLQAINGKYQFQLIRDKLRIFVDGNSSSMADFRWVPSEKIVYRRAELRDVMAKLVGHDTVERTL